MRIGLLLSDFMPDEYLPISGEYVDMFAAMFSDHDVTLIPYDAYSRQLPATVNECDGYIISGSRSSVNDDEQWIEELKQVIREAVAADVPMFGVCFGLQAMAEALGGNVEEFAGGWGGGVSTMIIDEPRSWMAGAPASVSLIMSHEDQVVALPPGATRLGSSDHCENFLIEFAPRHVGIQGHPEFQTAFAEAIYRNYRDTRGQAADDAIATLNRPTDALLVARWMHLILRQGRSGVL